MPPLWRLVEWRVEHLDENGCWQTHHEGTRAGPAIRAYEELDNPHKRLLRKGRPLSMSEHPSLLEGR